jgi:endonuclease YncB( thermonuclease family)
MNHIATRLICAVLFCASGLAHSAEFTAKIIAVLDGDTVLVRRESGLVKIRLAEIDAPEKAQTFGETSKHSLSDMVLGKQVKVVSQAVDQYGRLVAHLSVNGLDVNAEQIRRGMAWAAVGWRQSRRAPTGVPLAGAYSNFASLAASRQSLRDPLHSNQVLIALQNQAKQAPRGLWAQSDPTPPWEWRKQHPSTFSSQPSAAVSSVATPANTTTHDPGCGNKKHCSEMSSCEEAKYYFAQCGVKSLDGDGDGVPCEKLCAPAQ